VRETVLKNRGNNRAFPLEIVLLIAITVLLGIPPAMNAVVPTQTTAWPSPIAHMSNSQAPRGAESSSQPHGPRPVALSPLLSPGGDFTSYLGNIERTSSSLNETLINLTNAADLRPLWSFATGGPVQSQPLEQDGITYFGSHDGYEYALHANNGSLLWKTYLGVGANDSYCGPLGVTSTGTLLGNTLYVDGGYPYLFALNASTGIQEWATHIGGTSAEGYYQWASPLLYNGSAYIGISSDCGQPLVAAGLEEISLSSHAVVAEFNSSVPYLNGSSVWGSPSLNPATNTLFVPTGDNFTTAQSTYSDSIVALNATTLKVEGSFQIPNSQNHFDSDFGVTPTLFTPTGGYPMITAANKNGWLYALYQSNLTVAWEQRICCLNGQSDHVSTSWGGQYVYAMSPETSINGVLYNSSLRAFDPRTGGIVWEDEFPQSSYGGYSAPLWVNGVLIVPDQGTLYVVDATNGGVLAADTLGGQSQAAASVSRGEVFAGSTDFDVVAFDLGLGSVAEVSNTSGPAPLADSFTVSATGGLPPYTYNWTFGDGATSTLQDTTHSYSASGTYDVNVTVTDGAGTVSRHNLSVRAVGTSYTTTFTQSGLPLGTPWSVALAGDTRISVTGSLNFTEPNGSFPYAVGDVPGYLASPVSGSASVAGSNLSETIDFAPATYTIALSEIGLPMNANWEVTLGGVEHTSSTETVNFSLANGTYGYSVGGVAGYIPFTTVGTVVVAGSNLTRTLAFITSTTTVTFTETGLPSGTTWGASLGGVQHLASSPSVVFIEANGSLPFAIRTVSGYVASPAPSSLDVVGIPLKVNVTFTAVSSVTFTRTGLSPGTSWAVELGGIQITSRAPTILFLEPNGTYQYATKAIAGWSASPRPGPIVVHGANQSITVTFTPVSSVTFTETGLPHGTSWAVNVGGIQITSASSVVVFEEPNGTYSYQVKAVPGYTDSPSKGPVTVAGHPLVFSIVFSQIGSEPNSRIGTKFLAILSPILRGDFLRACIRD
jgi:outer membrane protein assembly factor BamB